MSLNLNNAADRKAFQAALQNVEVPDSSGFDVSGGSYPVSAAAAGIGKSYQVTVGGTVDAVDYSVGDVVVSDGTNWVRMDGGEPQILAWDSPAVTLSNDSNATEAMLNKVVSIDSHTLTLTTQDSGTPSLGDRIGIVSSSAGSVVASNGTFAPNPESRFVAEYGGSGWSVISSDIMRSDLSSARKTAIRNHIDAANAATVDGLSSDVSALEGRVSAEEGTSADFAKAIGDYSYTNGRILSGNHTVQPTDGQGELVRLSGYSFDISGDGATRDFLSRLLVRGAGDVVTDDGTVTLAAGEYALFAWSEDYWVLISRSAGGGGGGPAAKELVITDYAKYVTSSQIINIPLDGSSNSLNNPATGPVFPGTNLVDTGFKLSMLVQSRLGIPSGAPEQCLFSCFLSNSVGTQICQATSNYYPASDGLIVLPSFGIALVEVTVQPTTTDPSTGLTQTVGNVRVVHLTEDYFHMKDASQNWAQISAGQFPTRSGSGTNSTWFIPGNGVDQFASNVLDNIKLAEDDFEANLYFNQIEADFSHLDLGFTILSLDSDEKLNTLVLHARIEPLF